MHYDHTAALFQSLIEQMSLSVDVIADIAGNAADGLAECMSTGHNVFCCGIGLDAASATLLSELLRTSTLRERPTLPVIELSIPSGPPLTGAAQRLCDQLGALGHPGDRAVVFGSCLDNGSLTAIENMLSKRQIAVIWIGTQGSGPSLTFPGTSTATALSLCQASAVCLAELIDLTLFGPMEDVS